MIKRKALFLAGLAWYVSGQPCQGFEDQSSPGETAFSNAEGSLRIRRFLKWERQLLSFDEIKSLGKRLGLQPLVKFCRHPVRTLQGRFLFGRWDVSIFGDFTVKMPRNVRVGANLHINDGVFILGRNHIRIGNGVTLAARSMLLDGGPVSLCNLGNASGYKAAEDSMIEIGSNVLIGAGAIILPGVKIGDGAIIGSGAVVMGDVQPWTTVVGNPARVVWRSSANASNPKSADNSKQDVRSP